MTREEFVRNRSWILRVIRSRCELTQTEEDYLNDLIEVLEQEPCEDCISRKQAMKACYQMAVRTGIEEMPYKYAETELAHLPSVQPKPKTECSCEQIKWERDIAIEQLHELGYELGQKIEPCEDCISRAELLKAVDTWDKFGCDADTKLVPVKDCYVPYIHYDDVVKAIKGMPSIQPKTEWISVSERLPDKLNDVLITFYDCPNEYDVAYLRTTFNESYKKSGAKNEWVSSMGETTYADYEVDAWMPIHPYKLESEE